MSVYICINPLFKRLSYECIIHGGGNNNEPMGLAVDAVYDIEDE
jgi:hypothetical protein